ncbi:MAG: D-alanine/D-alanine ligase [Bacillales bacterium]|jgi:D-alanine-D-alanine ligase|nr:D-alanine/D-alanine ligase [Bacillales bacterium]
MRIKVGVIFGGVSVEHEVSVISALQAFHSLDEKRYEGVPIYISKNGDWYTGADLVKIDEYKDLNKLLNKCEHVTLITDENKRFLLNRVKPKLFDKKPVAEIDVAFPVIHGTNGEDGSLQGVLELAGVPYVGCDVLSSAVGMDKVIMKNVLRDSGVPIVGYIWFYKYEWNTSEAELTSKIETEIGYPVIVKPANLGSSVGISKAKNRSELDEAVVLAMSFANKIIVEKVVQELTEINCSVLGDQETAEASICEEVLGQDEILSYADKYQSNSKGSKGMSGTNRKIPAEISDEQTNEVKSLALKTFRVLGCSGVSRIDFLLDKKDGKVYVNEINTIPGSLSFYLWEPTGKSFTQLTTDLVQLAIKRQRERSEITFSYDSNLFSLHSGSKGSKLGVKRS